MPEQLTNLASTTLSAGITNSTLTIPLTDGSLFPATIPNGTFRITVGPDSATPEIIRVVSRSGNTLTAELRGDGGTTAQAWVAGTRVILSLTRESINARLADQIMPLRNLWNKIYNMQQATGTPYPHVKWMTSGDSMSQDLSKWYLPYLARAFGGIPAGAYFPGNYYGATLNSSTGTVVTNSADFDAWYSGTTYQYATAGTQTWGIGGSTFNCDLIKVFYVKGPASTKDGGDFKLQIDGVDQGSFLSVSTLNAGGITMGIATLTPTLGLHNLTIVCNTGPIRIIGVGMENTTIRGLVPVNASQGGIALNSPTTAAWANYTAFLANVLPDVLTYEAKEDSSYFPASLTTFFNAIAAGTTSCDVIAVGSSPTGPTTYGGRGDIEQKAQNAQLRAAAETSGYNYWDGYTLLGGWNAVNALGWGTDPLHLSDQANQYRAAQLMRDLGSSLFYGQPNPSDIAPAKGTINTSLSFGKNYGTPVATLDADNTFDFDLKAYLKRRFRFYSDAALATETISLDVATALGSNGFFNQWIRLGSGQAGFRSFGSSSVTCTQDPNGTTGADVQARSFAPYIITTNAAGGAVTANLASGTLQIFNLTSNITSFTFSNQGTNGQRIEVHFVQDATGSRTLAGANASIKWAGAAAPTLTTTASRRDIFVFVQNGGVYYEISRSMNVG